MRYRQPSARQLEMMRFIYQMDQGARERAAKITPETPQVNGVLGAGGCSHHENKVTHEALERRGWIYRMDSEEKDGSVQLWHLTPAGWETLQTYGMER